jgi:hypothetical protein
MVSLDQGATMLQPPSPTNHGQSCGRLGIHVGDKMMKPNRRRSPTPPLITLPGDSVYGLVAKKRRRNPNPPQEPALWEDLVFMYRTTKRYVAKRSLQMARIQESVIARRL